MWPRYEWPIWYFGFTESSRLWEIIGMIFLTMFSVNGGLTELVILMNGQYGPAKGYEKHSLPISFAWPSQRMLEHICTVSDTNLIVGERCHKIPRVKSTRIENADSKQFTILYFESTFNGVLHCDYPKLIRWYSNEAMKCYCIDYKQTCTDHSPAMSHATNGIPNEAIIWSQGLR